MSIRIFSKYVRKAEKKLAQVEKQQDLRPVIIDGGVIARTWWGKAWNENLESYADYASGIGRGRSIVACGAVLDLQVSAGEIKALVQGSRAKPYSVTIRIQKLNKNTWNLVASACQGKLESLEELLDGKFPKAVEEAFLQPKTGLFPSPKEIEFACSCPDWASMCKHTAATLYGIGARIDEDTTLFFTLRGVAPVDLIKGPVSSKRSELLQKASQKSSPMSNGAHRSAARGADRENAAGSATSASAVEIQTPESVRMADVRKVLKKQLKMDFKLAKKEKTSKKAGVKKIAVKGKANELVKKVVNKQFGAGKKR
jgi:uncharacterized Zn finger protein